MLTSYSSAPSKPCPVCEDPARYCYYGVIVCAACKVFFKRNASLTKTPLPCTFDDHCELKSFIRHRCKPCRLNKCYAVGMTVDKFRAARSTKFDRYSLFKAKNTTHFAERLPTLNMLRADLSTLTFDEWTLIANLSHIYEHSELLSIGKRFIVAHDALPSSMNLCLELVEEYLVTLYNTTGKYLRLNNDLRQLSYDERSPVLRNVADHVTCLGSAFLIGHCHLLHLHMFFDLMQRKYGKQTVDLQLWLSKFIDSDILIVKLAMALFALSENSSLYSSNTYTSLSNPLHLVAIQNRYATTTWKYLLYKYGYHESVMRFTRLISWLMATTVFMSHAQSLSSHVNEVNALVEQVEITLLLDETEETDE